MNNVVQTFFHTCAIWSREDSWGQDMLKKIFFITFPNCLSKDSWFQLQPVKFDNAYIEVILFNLYQLDS